MRTRTVALLIAVITLASIALGAFAYAELPQRIAVHWDVQGRADSDIDKSIGVFAVPLFAAALAIVMMLFPGFDPADAKISRSAYDASVMVFILGVDLLSALALFWNLYPELPFASLLALTVGVFLFLEAILFPELKRNWYVGIRTARSRSSAVAWQKTHRHGAKVFMIAGALTAVGALFPDHALLAILAPCGLAMLWLLVLSFIDQR